MRPPTTERTAASRSSATNAPVVTMMLSLTNAPIGSAFGISALYAASTGASSSIVPTEKPSTPSPLRAAMAYDDGLPAAHHIGGCGFFHGVGRILRAGRDQYLPSYPS